MTMEYIILRFKQMETELIIYECQEIPKYILSLRKFSMHECFVKYRVTHTG